MSMPFVIGKMIDLLKPSSIITEDGDKKNKEALKRWSFGLVGVFVVGAVANYGRIYFLRVSAERIVKSLRDKLFKGIVESPVSFFDAHRTGELVSRISNDTTVVGKAITVNAADGMKSSIQAMVGMGMMMHVSPMLSFVLISMMAPISIGAVVYGRYIKGLAKQTQHHMAESMKIAEEKMSNIKTVKSFCKESLEMQKYENQTAEILSLSMRDAKASASFMGMAAFAGNCSVIGILWAAGGLVMDGIITIGDLSSFLMYTLYVGTSLAGITGFYADLMKASGASSRIFEWLHLFQTNSPMEQKSLVKPALTGSIRFENVSYKYATRERYCLDSFSLSIEPGEIVAIVGESGVGKSTIMSLLLGFYPAEKGSITVDGYDIKDIDMNYWRSQVGYVSQEPVLFYGTIAENIVFGLPLHFNDPNWKDKMKEAARLANALDFIESFPSSFDTQVGEGGLALSGGQKQRIALARALIKDPKVLLLDEATSALDSKSEHLVQLALDAAMKGRTVIVIAHRPSTIRKANRICIMKNGKIKEGESSQES